MIDRRGRIWSDQPSSHQISTKLGPNSRAPDYGACWPNSVPKTPCIRNTGDNDNHYIGSRSYHPGGVNGLLGDGSVRFFKDSIDLATWKALSSRAGGEVISDRGLRCDPRTSSSAAGGPAGSRRPLPWC